MMTCITRHRRLRKKFVPYAYLSPTIVLMITLMLVPSLMVIGYSFMDNVIMNKNPVFVGLETFKKVLFDDVFFTALSNTLYFTVISVICHILLGLTLAMMLNTKLLNTVVKSVFRVIFILPWVFTVAVIAVLWRLMLNPNGIVNYLLGAAGLIDGKIEWLASRKYALNALTFINVWAGYPFYMISILAGLQGISTDLYEAATVDGANGFQRFFYVTIPQLRPILVSLAMMDSIWTMQQFALVWMITGGGPIHSTEMIGTYTYKLAFDRYQFSQASASASIILIISLCLSLLYVRNQKARE